MQSPNLAQQFIQQQQNLQKQALVNIDKDNRLIFTKRGKHFRLPKYDKKSHRKV